MTTAELARMPLETARAAKLLRREIPWTDCQVETIGLVRVFARRAARREAKIQRHSGRGFRRIENNRIADYF